MEHTKQPDSARQREGGCPESKARVLCILTTARGFGAMAAKIAAVLSRLPDLEPTYVHVDPEDYRAFPAPWWARVTDPWHAEFVARRKARPVVDLPFDLVLVSGWEFAVAFRRLARRLPAMVLLDAVPASIDVQQRRQGKGGWRRWLAYQIHHRQFSRAARAFRCFLPMGSDSAEALQCDYDIGPERCFVTLAPQDLQRWTAPVRQYRPPLKLLFVGNDFIRKGGDFLLNLYAGHLAGTWTLTIVSNDAAVGARELPGGVEWLRGRNREQLLEVYRSHDLFLLPTRQDYMPQVIGEALATGLPCLATDVGGIRDLVRDGQTGFLMPPGAPASAWADRLSGLAREPEEMARLSARARQFAEERLGLERFEDILGHAFALMRSAPDSLAQSHRA